MTKWTFGVIPYSIHPTFKPEIQAGFNPPDIRGFPLFHCPGFQAGEDKGYLFFLPGPQSGLFIGASLVRINGGG